MNNTNVQDLVETKEILGTPKGGVMISLKLNSEDLERTEQIVYSFRKKKIDIYRAGLNSFDRDSGKNKNDTDRFLSYSRASIGEVSMGLKRLRNTINFLATPLFQLLEKDSLTDEDRLLIQRCYDTISDSLREELGQLSNIYGEHLVAFSNYLNSIGHGIVNKSNETEEDYEPPSERY